MKKDIIKLAIVALLVIGTFLICVSLFVPVHKPVVYKWDDASSYHLHSELEIENACKQTSPLDVSGCVTDLRDQELAHIKNQSEDEAKRMMNNEN